MKVTIDYVASGRTNLNAGNYMKSTVIFFEIYMLKHFHFGVIFNSIMSIIFVVGNFEMSCLQIVQSVCLFI